ncbi:MAG: hypothetical protein K0S33_254 [Bacteroidetes bacterium]|jgi:hypothetical protein|nr:hypothetical protein [Bacteroidota bacterium]
MRALFLSITFLSCGLGSFAQFAPPAGQAGTSAIHKDSSAIVGWASACTIQRGLQDISNVASGPASVGDSSSAIGMAGTNGIVSLGDSGVAILRFAAPITNGAGYDFAVFENSFSDSFLEFGFVEVSSDGINYVRFPATCNIPDTAQTGSFGLSDATLVNNLAGKYRANYGTPFDLQELSGQAGLDINSVTHVKIIDVIGSVAGHATIDAFGHKVNDPFPTPFPSSGFDLDAVAALHTLAVGIREETNTIVCRLYPNPARGSVFIALPELKEEARIRVFSLTGMTCFEWHTNSSLVQQDISNLAAGIYFVEVMSGTKRSIQKLVIQ